MNKYFPVSRIALCVSMLLLAVAACAPQTGEPQPPEINYGQDTCDLCGMIISEPRYAAATLLDNGEARKFDDIGNMLVYHQQHAEPAVSVWFVHDYETEEWIRGESAFYVKSPAIKSPMGHGIAAFQGESAAEALAASLGSEVWTFDRMRREFHRASH